MYLSPVRTAPPGVEVVTLAEVKAHLRIDHADEDATLALYQNAAIEHFDGWHGVLGRCLIAQTWRFALSDFPAVDFLTLPFPDVSAVAVAYADSADADQVLAGSLYRLLPGRAGAVLELKKGQSWPSLYERSDAVRISVTAGFGPAASDVPPPIRSAILLRAGDLYHKRQDDAASGSLIQTLIAPFSRTLIGAGPF